MEENKQTNEAANTNEPSEPVQPISSEQAAEVAGGDGTSCTTTTLGPVTTSGSPTDVYDSLVDATSHVIDRVVNSF
jgi:hypothetical protein